MRSILKMMTAPIVLGGLAGAVGEYFLDPQGGKRRRHEARDRAAAFVRGRSRELGQKARYAQGVVEGVPHRIGDVAGVGKGEDYDDMTLVNKVESEIFRDQNAPKGQVDVNVEHGTVFLRGQLERPEQIDELVKAAGNVQGVKGVQNLLHLPETVSSTTGD
jgi:osmotically-inducible protein OsmY